MSQAAASSALHQAHNGWSLFGLVAAEVQTFLHLLKQYVLIGEGISRDLWVASLWLFDCSSDLEGSAIVNDYFQLTSKK